MNRAPNQEKTRLVPMHIVLLGGTGDLSRKKLLPALMDLYQRGFLPDVFKVLGFARSEYDDTSYSAFVRDVLNEKQHNHSSADVEAFLSHLHYQQGDFTDEKSYKALAAHLEALSKEIGVCTSKLFYVATSPKFYGTIADHLAASGLTTECGGEGEGWTRVLIEKPFGSDLTEARELGRKLGELFKEEQIFRIDHYLAKDAIQNILTFRFANVLFESSWNREFIEKVHIKLYEDFGVETRGSFFDTIGMLRDVGQNHMLQMLALIAMKNPGELESTSLHRRRLEVFEDLHTPSKEELETCTVRGQYEGYRDIDGVVPDSDTETYFLLKTFINNDRWQGVPFYLESGKAMGETRIEIVVYFRETKGCMCRGERPHGHQNVLTLGIQPTQSITMRFWAKKAGFTYELEARDLSFACEPGNGVPDAYEKVLYDCIVGDQTLFVSTEEEEAAWQFIMPIFEYWTDTAKLLSYKKGDNGPESDLKDEIL